MRTADTRRSSQHSAASWRWCTSTSRGRSRLAQQIAPIINSGHIVLLSWSAAKTTNAASIASGGQDAVIRSAATNMKALGGRILLRPFFEFDQPVGHPRYIGSPAQVVAAWSARTRSFSSVGATQCPVRLVADGVRLRAGVAQKFWPGSTYVDWVGPDGYNFPGVRFATGTRSLDRPTSLPSASTSR